MQFRPIVISNNHLCRYCAMCGKSLGNQNQILVEKIDDMDYVFDNEYCALVFKKFKSLYGSDFS